MKSNIYLKTQFEGRIRANIILSESIQNLFFAFIINERLAAREMHRMHFYLILSALKELEPNLWFVGCWMWLYCIWFVGCDCVECGFAACGCIACDCIECGCIAFGC